MMPTVASVMGIQFGTVRASTSCAAAKHRITKTAPARTWPTDGAQPCNMRGLPEIAARSRQTSTRVVTGGRSPRWLSSERGRQSELLGDVGEGGVQAGAQRG